MPRRTALSRIREAFGDRALVSALASRFEAGASWKQVALEMGVTQRHLHRVVAELRKPKEQLP
jgi:DNA-binding transcriptional regulator LsrR (DeoR family)